MSVHKEIALGDTVYFPVAVNDTSGSANDGSDDMAFDVRLNGATASAAPVYSGSGTLLTHANYQDGAYELAIPATSGNGFAWFGSYSVYVQVTADSQTPGGAAGTFEITPRAAGIQSTVHGTVDNTAFTASQTELEADDITEATAGHYVGRSLIFYRSADTAVFQIATKITAYTFQDPRGHFTYDSIAAIPPDNAEFIIV